MKFETTFCRRISDSFNDSVSKSELCEMKISIHWDLNWLLYAQVRVSECEKSDKEFANSRSGFEVHKIIVETFLAVNQEGFQINQGWNSEEKNICTMIWSDSYEFANVYWSLTWSTQFLRWCLLRCPLLKQHRFKFDITSLLFDYCLASGEVLKHYFQLTCNVLSSKTLEDQGRTLIHKTFSN